MVRVLCFVIALAAVFARSPRAQATDLVIWEPGPGFPTLVIPAIPGLTAEEDVKHYLKELNAHPDLPSFGPQGSVSIPTGNARIVHEIPQSQQPTFAVFANRTDHLFLPQSGKEAQVEMTMVNRQLSAREAKVYVLPLVAESGLSPELAEKFRAKVAMSFDSMLALGSPSAVHPTLYGESVIKTDPKLLSLANDNWRLDTIQKFNHAERGVYYGYCWGHQVCAVAQGGKLIQSIETETHVGVSHYDTWHPIKIDRTSTLYQILGRDEVYVNSYHFQAVKVNPNMPVEVVARSTEATENVVEAIEFKNGLGMTFQFHPEYMETKAGRIILTGMVRYAKSYKSLRQSGLSRPPCLRKALQQMLKDARGSR